jgi:preprotein translocase subunit SecG
VVTTRIAKRGILSRRTLIVANAMVLISFALGYLWHPTF